MRKLLAILLVASMLVTVALCAFAVSAAEPTNVAEGKKYVTSPLHRQGGKEVNWAWDENAPITYEDTDGVELTDGIFPADVSYQDAAFFGFSHSTPGYEERGYSYIRIDLEETYDLSKLILYVGSAALKNGIQAGGLSVSYYKVDNMDGANPVEIGTTSEVNDEDPDAEDAKGYIAVELDVEASARYIEIRLVRGGWVFVTEFEAYAADGNQGGTETEPEEPKEPEIITETIEVNGDLTDTGWDKAVWNTFNLWQQPKAAKPEDRTAKSAVRTDADNIYVAFVINGTIAPNITSEYADKVAGGLAANGAQTSTYTQTGATSFRLWLRTNDAERYLIDVQYLGEELGWTATRAIYPSTSTLTWDDLADLIDIAVVYADGNVTAEFAINKAAFGVEDDFRMFFSYWDNYQDLVDETYEEAYQVIHVCSENAQTTETGVIQYYSGPENQDAYITFKGADTVLGTYTVEDEPTVPDDTYEDDIAALVGADRESADFAIDLESAIEDGVMTVTLTVKDIKEGVLMHALMAHLYYDTERLELTNKINKDMSVECATALPYGDDSEWENLTKVSKDEEGMIDISFVVAVDPDQYIDADHPIVLTFTFKVLEGFDKAGVYIPTASVTSKFVGENTESSKDYVGNGAYTVATTKTAPAPDDSSSTPSEGTSSGTTKPGDAGILVFAILGILAVAGAATVIKVRH